MRNPQVAYAPSVSALNNPDPCRSNLGFTEKGSKNKAGGPRRLPLLLFELGLWLIQRTANRQGDSVENAGVNVAGVMGDETLSPVNVGFLSTVGIVHKTDGIADTSTTLRQAQDMAQRRPDGGVSWVLVPSGFPPDLTGCGCSAIMPGKVTMGIRQKSAHRVIIQEDFRKCNPVIV